MIPNHLQTRSGMSNSTRKQPMTKLLSALSILLTTQLALADGLVAKFAGTVTETSIDYDGDGFNGRTGLLEVNQPSIFRSITAAILDAKLGPATAECPNGTIVPSGIVILRGWGSGIAVADVDPSVVECLLFDPEHAAIVEAVVSVADGPFAWLFGTTLRFELSDSVLLVQPGPIPAPRVVLTVGEMQVL